MSDSRRVTLHCGDCLPFMQGMGDKSVVSVTDPPYGIKQNMTDETMWRVNNISKRRYSNNYQDYSWDNERISQDYFQEIFRVSKSQVFFGGNYYTDYLPPSMGWIIWDKLNSGDFSDCEMAWTSQKRAARMFRYLWNGFIKQKPEERYHPAQKPLDLMRWIIENYTDQGGHHL